MELSSMMGAQLVQLQHTVNLNLLSMAKNMQAAGATVMLEDFTKNQNSIQQAAPHPTSGQSFDVSV